MHFGVVVLIVFILVALAAQGPSVSGLLSSHAALIVIGGTLAATFMSYPAKLVFRIPRLSLEAMQADKMEVTAIAATLIQASDRLRASGASGLQGQLKQIKDPFLKRGLQYIAEGFDAKEIQDLMEAELSGIRSRHRHGIAMFESLGGYSPTLGIMGTVMSMVGILSNLDNPDKIGPEIANAMVATFYGVAVANLFWIPVANRLKKLSEEEMRLRSIMIDIVLAMQAGANPRTIRERLRAALPPETRKVISEGKSRRTAQLEMAAPEAE
ncbi:MAG: MotA/TolQ/ExbB proton channel family protein [bacterium]|nr:MotA/TolQ/ExbB proton channel family protein [bacterium]